MCLLFAYVNPNPRSGQYKVIVVNNRDEIYARPTRPAHVWEGNPSIIAGEDLMEGREGGTWLGLSSSGKIASLLNILQPREEATKNQKDLASRGYLVVNYLRGEKPASKYLHDLATSDCEYNKFNLVILEPDQKDDEFSNKSYRLMYYNSSEKRTVCCEPGVHGFGNSNPAKPFKKVCEGVTKIEAIIKEIGPLIAKQKELVESLFNLMRNEEPYHPDDVMTAQGKDLPEILLKSLSRIFVTTANGTYGTRTTTIVLVGEDDKAVFHERTMRVPINPTNPVWDDVVLYHDLSPPRPQ
ncbi:transport and Golgi organization 2 homolog [Hyalella azteca]|uniref:Transport and Golgi organization 2 homolog n=1 Tax=Hyalella azteca TaxID=294128 RepID=A0A8B7N0T8_HYAAZ|nr:transport and Golgi organization 2 homolog [Hyalella azteca]